MYRRRIPPPRPIFAEKTLGGKIFAALLLAVFVAAFAGSLPAQSPAPLRPYYDAAREVTLRGTVSKILAHSAPGMISGSHLLVTTSSGEIDASLGRFAFASPSANQGADPGPNKDILEFASGQPVQLTGVMKTLLGRQVFLVRTVTTNGRVFPIRNAHGIPISPQSRLRASQKAESL